MDRRTFLTTTAATGAALLAAPAAAAAPRAAAPVPGTWTTTADVPGMPPVRHETTHFAFRWRDGDVDLADAAAAGRALEATWEHFTRVVGFREPDSDRSTKRRAHVHVDPSHGLSGGVTAEGEMAIWIGPGALRDRFGLAHELTHAMQGASGGLRDSPWASAVWETHANYMATQLPEYRGDLHGSGVLVDFPHVHHGSSRNNYLSFPFLEHLKQRHGYGVVNDLWTRSPRSQDPARLTVDPWSVLAANQGWSTSRLNDEFAVWAVRNVTFDATDLDGTDRGPLLRAGYGSYDDRAGERRLRVTELDPLGRGTWGVPFAWAPQRWGYNLVRLLPEPGARSVTVRFAGERQSAPAVPSLPPGRGVPAVLAPPASGWRWAVVVTTADGRPRYGQLQRSAAGTVRVPLRPDDRAVHLVVLAAPTTVQRVAAEQVHRSIYRYPWRVALTGAVPDDGEAVFLAANPGARRHPNGGGWVAPGARVAATAFVGPTARVVGGEVTGRARLLERATVLSGTVRDDAVVRGISIVSGRAVVGDRAVVDTTYRGVGAYGADVVVGGTAHALGDLELWTTRPVTSGAHSGFVDDEDVASSPAGPVAEVTARPAWSPAVL